MGRIEACCLGAKSQVTAATKELAARGGEVAGRRAEMSLGWGWY